MCFVRLPTTAKYINNVLSRKNECVSDVVAKIASPPNNTEPLFHITCLKVVQKCHIDDD